MASSMCSAAGCDAGIRYEERLEQDMIAVPIGPRDAALRGRRVTRLSRSPRARPAPSPRPARPCLLAGPLQQRRHDEWEFERDGEVVKIDPTGPLTRHRRRRDRSRGRSGDRRHRRRRAVRGLAAAAPRQRRPRAGARTVVAAILRPVSLLPGPPPSSRAAARLRRFRQSVDSAKRLANSEAQALACYLSARPG